MANIFSGTILDQKGIPIIEAQIKVVQDGKEYTGTGPDPSLVGSYTNEKGEFRIQIDEPIDPKKVTLTVTKAGKEIRSISNPGATSKITAANLQITKEAGGRLILEGKYEGGEYYFESLGGKGSVGDLVRDEFDLNMRELEGLIKDCTLKNVPLELIITGSESTIPNTDNEPFLPDGKTPNPNNGKPISEDKGLAKKRVEYLNKHITEDLFNLDNKRWVNSYNTIKKEAYQVNGPPYPGNANYKQYQYVSIFALPTKPLCATTYVAPGLAGEKKEIPYVAPGSTDCSFIAFEIPDRFGFNGYLLPHYTFIKNYGQAVLKDAAPIAWGIFIYMYLYLKNGSAAFLDVTTPGLALNHTVLQDKKFPPVERTLPNGEKIKIAEKDENDTNSIWYAATRLAFAIDKDNQNKKTTGTNGFFNYEIYEGFNRLLTNYPNFFTLTTGTGASSTQTQVTPDSDWNSKRFAINSFFQKLINSNVKIAIIEVINQRQDKIKLIDPVYGLTPDGYNNYVMGISSTPIPKQSKWAYCICDKPFDDWPTGGKGGAG
jgi:hypothetical protein